MLLLFVLSLSVSLSVMLMSFGFCILDALKVSPNENVKGTDVKKEVVCKDDQLALDVKGLNLMDEVTKDGKTDGFCILDALKVSPNENVKETDVKKEVVCKDDQLALDVKGLNLMDEVTNDGKTDGKRAQSLTFDELAEATGNFRADCFLGEGGFGKVYKGHLAKINQVGWSQFDFRISLLK